MLKFFYDAGGASQKDLTEVLWKVVTARVSEAIFKVGIRPAVLVTRAPAYVVDVVLGCSLIGKQDCVILHPKARQGKDHRRQPQPPRGCAQRTRDQQEGNIPKADSH